MTSARPFEQDLPVLLEDLYLAGMPDYRDDLVATTARTPQRPAWTFPERWLPMDVVARRLPIPAVPLRAIAVVILLLIVAIVGLLVGVGSQQRVPPPFGPARNGAFGYGQNDSIYARDSISSPQRLLVGGDGTKNGFWGFSPDGTKMLFQRTETGVDYLMVADADGQHQRRILEQRMVDDVVAWSPDSRTVAVANDVSGLRTLVLAHVDGSPATSVDIGPVEPTDLAWRPPFGAQLLFRGEQGNGKQDLYLVNSDGTGLHGLGLPSNLIFGSQWDVSGPSWSPVGDRIAYNQIEPISADPGGHFRIHVVMPDGTGDVTLPGPSEPLVQEAWPVWSPDGRWIAVEHFVFGEPGEDWLAMLPSDGSVRARDLLNRGPASPGGGIVKNWSPDGTRVIAYNKGTGRMWSIDPSSGRAEEITWTAGDLPDMRRMAP
jgi:dipeptidyl aminopeptidase/acylaminoacyl peptidase